MKSSSELKREAKEILRGRWKDAVLMNLIPTLIMIGIVVIVMIPLIVIILSLNLDGSSASDAATGGGSGGSGGGGILGGIITFIFASGMSWTYLDLYRGDKQAIDPFSDAFRAWRSPFLLGIICIYLLTVLFSVLWTLLFIIPGIIKAYAYSQANFVYYDVYRQTGEKPKALACITSSRNLMNGYKGQLFWLDLTFIGWHILAMMTLGIGYLWLTPYITATKAAFYNDLPKTANF